MAQRTAVTIRNRVTRWYLVVQARRLIDAGWNVTATAERLGIGRRTVTRWRGDSELWQAAAVAPDSEAVGPPKRNPTALEVLSAAAVGPNGPPPDNPKKTPRSGDAVPSGSTAAGIGGKEGDGGGAAGGQAHDEDASGADSPPAAADHEDGGGADGAGGSGAGGSGAGRALTLYADRDGHEDGGSGTEPGETGHEAHEAHEVGHEWATGSEVGHGGPRVGHEVGHDERNAGETSTLATAASGQRQRVETLRGRYNLDGTEVGKSLRRIELDGSDPLDITPELALLRATVEGHIREAKDRVPCDECGQLPGLDLRGIGATVDKISRAVERIEKSRDRDAISRADFVRFCTHVGRVVVQYVPDEDRRAQISEAILAFRI